MKLEPEIIQIILVIILGLLISYLIISFLLGKNIFIKWFSNIIKFVKRKKIIYELEEINYFKYHSEKERMNLINAINIFGTKHLINGFAFQHDKRTFLIEINIDNNVLQIDNIGKHNKFSGLEMSHNFNNEEFIQFCKKIGISVNFKKQIEFDDVNETDNLEFEINNNQYKIVYPYLNKEILYSQFATLLNNELAKINSGESFYLYDYYPTILILANKQIIKYFNKQGVDILSPENWINNNNH